MTESAICERQVCKEFVRFKQSSEPHVSATASWNKRGNSLQCYNVTSLVFLCTSPNTVPPLLQDLYVYLPHAPLVVGFIYESLPFCYAVPHCAESSRVGVAGFSWETRIPRPTPRVFDQIIAQHRHSYFVLTGSLHTLWHVKINVQSIK